MQKNLILTVIVFLAALSAPAIVAQPKVTVSGYVHDSSTEETLIGAAYMGALEIPRDAIKNAPAILGEIDVIKVIQTVPGVQPGMGGFSGLHVRVGGADENLTMLDGTVFSLSMRGMHTVLLDRIISWTGSLFVDPVPYPDNVGGGGTGFITSMGGTDVTVQR